MKIIITNQLQEHIDYLHQRLGNVEWSGALFYMIEDMNVPFDELTFIAKYVFPMDVGTQASTGYDFGPEIMDAYDIFADAINCREGTIHTHHKMGGFFSSTDIIDLRKTGEGFDMYVSLVVDTVGKPVAKLITYPTSHQIYIEKNGQKHTFNVGNGEAIIQDLEVVYEPKRFNIDERIIDRVNILATKRDTILAKEKQSWEKNTQSYQAFNRQGILFPDMRDEVSGYLPLETTNPSEDELWNDLTADNPNIPDVRDIDFTPAKMAQIAGKWLMMDDDSTHNAQSAMTELTKSIYTLPHRKRKDELDTLKFDLSNNFMYFVRKVLQGEPTMDQMRRLIQYLTSSFSTHRNKHLGTLLTGIVEELNEVLVT